MQDSNLHIAKDGSSSILRVFFFFLQFFFNNLLIKKTSVFTILTFEKIIYINKKNYLHLYTNIYKSFFFCFSLFHCSYDCPAVAVQ